MTTWKIIIASSYIKQIGFYKKEKKMVISFVLLLFLYLKINFKKRTYRSSAISQNDLQHGTDALFVWRTELFISFEYKQFLKFERKYENRFVWSHLQLKSSSCSVQA